jgi:SecD/SecF fusion protein
MFKSNFWKLLLSVLIAAWAVSELIPFRDIPFPDYVRDHATARRSEFNALLDEAGSLARSGKVPSVFVGLKQIGQERKIDLSQFFPDLRLESSLKNIGKRNDIILTELLHRSKARLQLGLDLNGGVAVTLQVDDKAAAKDSDNSREEKLSKAVEIIGLRINSLGVAEPLIRAVGDNRIEIELPGINTKDNPEIIDDVKKPARLDFRVVHPTLTPAMVPAGETPPGYQLMTVDEPGPNGEENTEELFVKRIPEMTGESISDASARQDPYGKPEVVLNLTKEGQKRFSQITREIAEMGQKTGRPGRLAIVLDGKLYEAPTVREEIDSDSAEISGGSMTDRDAIKLADVLNNPLDLPLVVKEQFEVGPSLAKDAVDSGLRSAVIGTAAVAAFMITFYATGGLVAVGTLAVNIIIILGIMANFRATMTLPGLAGIVLTIGMAVDANILIFERMREELAAGKSLSASNHGGYGKALTTIIDAHIVQLIICMIMIWLGTGPIKGFGVTLMIGVLSTMFSVLITAHMVMEFLIDSQWVKKITFRHLLGHLNIDFIKYRRPAFIGSSMLIVLGVAMVLYKGSAIEGTDFLGGDVIKMEFAHRIDISSIRAVAVAEHIGEVDPAYESPLGGGKELLTIETPEGRSDAMLSALMRADPAAGLVKVSGSHVGASIGREVLINAILAVGVSMLTILVYIAFRFEFGFGVGAMFSTLHDIFMTIGIFVITGHQFSAPMVAAILCVAGYSINETVVVFDRIREELKVNPNGSLRVVVNSAINKVFARTIMTASTTFLAALSLYLFGSGVLKDISFTFLVGIVTSTFSAIFIAAQVFYWWHKGDRKHVEAHADLAPKYEWTGSSKASQ